MSWNEVVRRARNQCGICGFPIRPDLGHAWSATLDHIVPLAHGGLHRQDNVQLAHFVCNVTKGSNRPGWRDRLATRLRTDSPFARLLAHEGAA